MNNLDKSYTALLQDILDNGVTKQDRTGTGTISVFGRTIRHNMKDGFPLLTTKKMHWKSIVTELLWFLRGDTNIKYLVDNGCHIWDGDAYKRYWNSIETSEYDGIGPTSIKLPTLTKEEFINKIKNDDEFAKKWGDLGPIYGKQWRSWGELTEPTITYNLDNVEKLMNGIDQIANSINLLKTDPDSRRNKVSAWNVGELDQMTIPPCHTDFQFYTRELSRKERSEYYYKHGNSEGIVEGSLDRPIWENDETAHKWYDENDIPTRAISLMWNQRSCDLFLGIPFNIASYGLLLQIIAREVNMVPDELIGNLGDVHLYNNHIEQAKEQIGREYTEDERIEFLQKTGMDALVDGKRQEFMEANIPKRTRQPFELPTVTITERNWYQHEKVKEHLGEKTFIQKIESYRPEDFTLNNYQSHPAIKAPLSN
jgi:thymidylate synthase